MPTKRNPHDHAQTPRQLSPGEYHPAAPGVVLTHRQLQAVTEAARHVENADTLNVFAKALVKHKLDFSKDPIVLWRVLFALEDASFFKIAGNASAEARAYEARSYVTAAKSIVDASNMTGGNLAWAKEIASHATSAIAKYDTAKAPGDENSPTSILVRTVVSDINYIKGKANQGMRKDLPPPRA